MINFRFRFNSNKGAIKSAAHSEPDITLLAFGRRWPCHRDILSQSNFFRILLNGSFRESKLHTVELRTHDEIINDSSFEKLIDALYDRDMTFAPDDIFNITVTAQYFQMDDIVDFCEDKIAGMLSSSNAIDIYHFADRYFLTKTRENAFQWMLLKLLPVKHWDELTFMTLDLAEKLIGHPRLTTQNEMYLYWLLKILIQIELNGTCCMGNDSFYKKIRNYPISFLGTRDGVRFRQAFQALRLGNILVRKDNVEVLLNDNIIPKSVIDEWIFKNWMSLVSIESPENFGPTADLVTKDEFEAQSMRFAKIIYAPDFHSWKFVGFSFAFDLALFFDGRTLIIKRVHQINEHKVSHSHLLRRIMLRFDIAEMNSSNIKRQQEIQTITMTTNEEICVKQLKKEPNYPCRISIEVLFHVPYKACPADKNLNLVIDNEDVVGQDESTGSLLRTSINRARGFKSYKKFFS